MKLEGTNVLITGANTGIGRVTALALAKRGAHVTLACRSRERTQPVLDEIARDGGHGEFTPIDLGDMASVRACARGFLARDQPLAILINNGGLAGSRGMTKDGFELAFGTNHLGHYLLTRLLLPALDRAGEARVVNVASKGHTFVKTFDWEALRKPTATTTGFPEYCVSKLANVLFSSELARRAPRGVHTYSLHPGAVASDVWREVPWGLRHVMKLFMLSNEQGAKTTIWCATSEDVREHTGRYYESSKELRPSKLALDVSLARDLWEKSAAWTGFEASVGAQAAAAGASVAPTATP